MSERVALRHRAQFAFGALLVLIAAMVVLLALVVVLLDRTESGLDRTNERLERTNDRIGRTNERIAKLNRRLEPVTDLAPDFLRRGLPYLQVTRRDIERLSDQAVPDLRTTTNALAAAVIPAAQAFQRLELARTAALVRQAAAPLAELLATRPVGETVSALRAVFQRVDRLDVVRDADAALEAVPEIHDDIDDTAETLRDSLVVQCLILEHIRSIDRKTGGEVGPERDPDRPPPECRPGPGGETDERRETGERRESGERRDSGEPDGS